MYMYILYTCMIPITYCVVASLLIHTTVFIILGAILIFCDNIELFCNHFQFQDVPSERAREGVAHHEFRIVQLCRAVEGDHLSVITEWEREGERERGEERERKGVEG